MNPRYSAAPAGRIVRVRYLGSETREGVRTMSALEAMHQIAWRDFILYAWEQPELRAQFERDTRIKVPPPVRARSPIEVLVDQETGATAESKSILERFIEWATRTHYGLEHAPRAYQAHLREAQVARSFKSTTVAKRVCALCADDLPDDEPLRLRPEGKNGENVPVCADCDTEHPRTGRYSFSEGATAPSKNSIGDGNKRSTRAR